MMHSLADVFASLIRFIELGGPVLLVIALLLLVLWTLLFERIWFFKTRLKVDVERAIDRWEAREERTSIRAHQIREAIVSRVSQNARQSLPMIKTLVALAPLLGLLGTVTGMISVFEVLSFTAGGDAKSMAGGVARATIPTMAGMVTAISGVFGSTYITRIAEREKQLLEDRLTMDH